MLREIRLQNYAIIHDISLAFSDGFSVITGETGAGKSILIEALSLLLGGRSDTQTICRDDTETILEARFDPSEGAGTGDDLIVKRILSSQSKSRVYINGSMANLSTLKQIGISLAEIHGQHDHHLLVNPSYQLFLLDAYAGLLEDRQRYQAHYQKQIHLSSEITALRQDLLEKGREAIIRHQISEIENANLKSGEEEALEHEDRYLRHGEMLLSATQDGYAMLTDDGGVLSRVREIMSHVQRIHQTVRDAESEVGLLQNAEIALRELALLLRDRFHRTTYDPERQQIVAERLALIQRLKRRYGDSIEAILAFKDQLYAELTSLEDRAAHLKTLEKEQAALAITLMEEAQSLSKGRHGAIDRFKKKSQGRIVCAGDGENTIRGLNRAKIDL